MSEPSNLERIAIKFFEICVSINFIEKYTKNVQKQEFLDNTMMQDAIFARFINIGECASGIKKIDPHFTAKHTNVAWRSMSGFRNIIAHDYFAVSLDEAWQTIINDIPSLKNELRKVLNNEPELKEILEEEIAINKEYNCDIFEYEKTSQS